MKLCPLNPFALRAPGSSIHRSVEDWVPFVSCRDGLCFVYMPELGSHQHPSVSNTDALLMSYLATYYDVPPLSLRILLDTKYNTPNVFGLAWLLNDLSGPCLLMISEAIFLKTGSKLLLAKARTYDPTCW